MSTNNGSGIKTQSLPPYSKGVEKKRPPNSHQLTVMIVRRFGKVRSFKISSRFFFWASSFFILYLIASVIIFNKYFDELRVRKDLSLYLGRVKQEIEVTKRELYRSQQHLALLEDYIDQFEARNEKEKKSAGSESVTRENPLLANESPSGEKVEKETQETLVEIKDFDIQKEGMRVEVTFQLVNVHSAKTPVSGYVHIIATNKESKPPQLWTFPKVALRNGAPINYKNGQLFIINRFKIVRGTYFLNSENEFPSSIKVLVYNQSGDLILEKECGVKKAS